MPPKMVDLELDNKESEKETVEAQELEKPKYPWGTSMCLEQDVIEKLGFKDLPEVGEEFIITAKVHVTGVGKRETKDEEYKNINLQMTEMSLEPFKEDGYAKLGKKIYSKKK